MDPASVTSEVRLAKALHFVILRTNIFFFLKVLIAADYIVRHLHQNILPSELIQFYF